MELYFFILGVVNGAFLISIFMIRGNSLDILKRIGWIYLLLAIPTIFGFFFAAQEKNSERYIIFLGIFLTFLFVEWLYDYVLKINFRENWKKNWTLMLPYLGLYYAHNYGFLVMPWKHNLLWGLVMLSLFIVQIITNLRSHPKISS